MNINFLLSYLSLEKHIFNWKKGELNMLPLVTIGF